MVLIRTYDNVEQPPLIRLGKSFQFSVKMLSGRKLQVQGDPLTRIHAVAYEISSLEGVKTTEMQLSYKGEVVWDGPRYEIDDGYLDRYLHEVSTKVYCPW